MSLDVYFGKDIAYVLTGQLVVAVETHMANNRANVEHFNGIYTLARGIALSFGLSWTDLLAEARQSLCADSHWILDQSSSGLLEHDTHNRVD